MMKVIKPYHEHMSKQGLTPYQFIEKIGRTCYKSEDKITEDSAVKFVQGLVKRKHLAMIEHHWVHMVCDVPESDFNSHWDMFSRGFTFGSMKDLLKYVEITYGDNIYISAPLRVFLELHELIPNEIRSVADILPSIIDEIMSCVENYYDKIFPVKKGSYRVTRHCYLENEEDFISELVNDLVSYECSNKVIDSEVMKHTTHTVLFVCDRGVSHELVRHRPCSFAQESTRYCNYSQNKFGEEITVILPFFFDTGMGTNSNSLVYEAWKYSCEVAERKYFELLNYGATPQEARSVLPNSLKTEIIMTANETEWQHIVDLRAKDVTGPAHPQMKEIMYPWYEELKELSGGRIK